MTAEPPPWTPENQPTDQPTVPFPPGRPAEAFAPPPAPEERPFTPPSGAVPPPFQAPPSFQGPPPYGAAPQSFQGPPSFQAPPSFGAPQAFAAPPYGGAAPSVPGAVVAPAAGSPRARKRSRVLISVGSLVTVSLVGLGAAAIAFGGGGASSPEEAVEQLAVAIDGEDVLAAVATLAPDETRSLPDLYQESVRKARELDDDSGNDDDDSADGSDLWEGLDLKVEGLEFETTELSEDLAKVEIVDGTISFDVEKGSLARERFDSFYETWLPLGFDDDCEYLSPDDMDEIDASAYEECLDGGPERETHGEFDFSDADDDIGGVFAMAVKRDGGWYVSPLFTIAEYARIGLDSPEPDSYTVDAGPAADSPTAAVEALAAGVEDLDVDAIVDSLSSELNVWRVYGETVDESGLDEDIMSLTVDDLELREEPIDDDRVRVVIEKAHFTAVVEEYDYGSDEYDDYDDYESDDFDEEDLPKIEVTYESWLDGDCVTTRDSTEGSEEETQCAGEQDGGIAKALGLDRIALVAVTDRDGWAVSPIETIADLLRTVVSHLDKPLVERIGLELFLGDGDIDRESSATLDPGDNEVELDSAGVAVVDVVLDDGDFATVSSPDDDVSITLPSDNYFSEVVTGGTTQIVVTGPIGAHSATVTVDAVETTELPGVGADGSLPAPVTGTVDVGGAVAFTTTAATYRQLDIDLGWNLYTDELDEDGEWTYVDEDTDDDEVITILVTNYDDGDSDDPDDGFGDDEPDANRYTFTFFPAGGGFADGDHVNNSVTSDEDGYYPTTRVAVVDGQPVDVTVTSPVAASVELYCSSTNSDGTPYDPYADDEDVFDEDDDYEYDEYPSFLELEAGVPGTARITPGDSEVCDLDVYTDDYVDDPASLPPVTFSVVPAAP